ncbi:MAG TPA: serine hydrolase domain-containing protein, partial [Catenuloplanes sp.]
LGLAVLPVAAPARAAGPGPAGVDAPGPDPATIERYVTDYARRAGYPGVAVAITRNNRVVLAAGYGHDSSGAAMTARTPMPVASVSKSFTAMAVLRLVEAGRVRLDSPVREHLPEFRIADPRGDRITVRQLLNHTSGISDRSHPEKSLPQPDSLAGAVERARTATLVAQPGTEHHYTNTNYHIAARLVEVVAGQPFGEQLRRHVLEPLGMRASATIDAAPRDLPDNLRRGHSYAYGASVAVAEPHRFLNGSDGLITTADDMARWLILHNNGGRAADGTRLVSAGVLAALHRPTNPGSRYGLGWQLDQQGRVHHTGIWFTYTASQLLLPSGYGIAVMSNSGIGPGNEGTAGLAEGLAAILDGGTPKVGPPVRLLIDLVLGAFTLLSLALGVRTVRRAPGWARRLADRPGWRPALRLLPRLVPLGLLAGLPALLGRLVGGGRDLTHAQLLHYSAPLVLWSVVASLMGVSVLLARAHALLRLRRATRTAPATRAPAQVAAL